MAKPVRPARFALALILSAAATIAPAQTANGIQVFPADYFASARPADAYDMVRRLPGFDLIEGDSDVRGFAGSRGNVLFDGRPPSGKQESLEQALRRIPANSVLRIELIRGGGGNSATSDYDLVANIVRRHTFSLSGAALAGATASGQAGVEPGVRLELSRQSGDRGIDAAFALESEIDDDSGRGKLIERNTSGVLTGVETRNERELQRTISADAEWKTPLLTGDFVANLNLARERTSEAIRAETNGETSLTTERERLRSGEAGVQYRLAGLGGRIESVAFHRFGRLRREEADEDEHFREHTRTSESVARVEYRRGTRLETFASVEGAVNRLSSGAVLEVDGQPVDLAGSDVDVTERRAEAAVGAIWKPLSSLAVEPSMNAEVSSIRSTGDSPQSEHFLFWKPRFRVSWNHGQRRVQATVEREVAQLDFSDFVASAELDRDEVSAGATALRPPTTWALSALVEQRFWGDGTLLVTVRHEWIDDVIDRVVVEQDGELFDAVGNIGKGSRTTVRAELTAPFDSLGIPGMQVRAALTFLRSRVTDPTTGERRIISEDRPFEGDLHLIHDVPGGHLSWGVDASFAHRERKFRFDQLRLERKGTAVGGFIEYRPAADWRLRFEAANVTSRRLVEERLDFDGSRATESLESIERRRIRTIPIFTFTVRKAFGGAR